MKACVLYKSNRGFGFVEVFVVVAIVGILTGIAIPAMSGTFQQSESAKTQRNALSIVATFNAARAAGNQTSYASADAAIDGITNTASPLNGLGVFANSYFTLAMGSDEIAAAKLLIADAIVGSDTTGTLAIGN